jgi:choline dehydrogenase
LNWLYDSEPEPELHNRRLYQPRGKVLGGTSAINGLMYIRGNRADYDEWRDKGCAGWGYDDVLPYFKKSENQQRGADAYHGVGGPLGVSDHPEMNPVGDAIVQAGKEIGAPYNEDFNGATQDGIGYYQLNTFKGRRHSAAAAYLKPAHGRANLAIKTNAHATRIVFEANRAVAVEYRTRSGPRGVQVRGEVLVCGGAFNSPQLLQLSGLGGGALLQQYGIPVVRDMSGVGENLQDHPHTPLMFRCTDPITLNDVFNSGFARVRMVLQYLLSRSGPMATNSVYAGGFFRSDPASDRPDMQIVSRNWSTGPRINAVPEIHPFPGFMIGATHLRPRARGTVNLKSRDPLAAPAIKFNFFNDQRDRDTLVWGVKLVRRLAAAPALSRYVHSEVSPGVDVVTDDEILDFCRENLFTVYHPAGTCRMGVGASAVVDPRLRVRGVDATRVVDTSIMPNVVVGNTNAPAIMIGEKASDMILQDAR